MEGLSFTAAGCLSDPGGAKLVRHSCHESSQGSANTHRGGTLVPHPQVQGDRAVCIESPCNTTGAITQMFRLKQNETKDKSVYSCKINTKSLLRAQGLIVFIYWKCRRELGRYPSHGRLPKKPTQTESLPSSFCSCQL